MISLPNLILLNIRILANGEGIFKILKLRLVSVICDREVQAKRKPRNRWLNSDKELITYQLLADGFRGAYGQIPSDF